MSVIRDWAKYLGRNQNRYTDFGELFTDAYHYSLLLLEKTKTQMQLLRKHNVVDAGAAGFVRFLEGINRVINSSRTAESFAEEPFEMIVDEEEASAYRYCTEALVSLTAETGDNMLVSAVKTALQGFGDSLIVSARGGKLKVHIHTNTPELVMQTLGKPRSAD